MKKQPAKLTPTTSQAKYPTLIDLRRDGGLLFNGVAAAVLATGLAGCGKNADEPVRTAGVVDASYFQQEVRLPGDTAAPDAGIPDRVPISDGLPPMPSYFDADLRTDTADATTPDAGAPDTGAPDRVMIIDGVPALPYDAGIDTAAKDAADARSEDLRQDSGSLDNAPGTSVDGSTDTELDVK